MDDGDNRPRRILIDCVACDDGRILDHGQADNLRPNGDKMHVYECTECGEIWKE